MHVAATPHSIAAAISAPYDSVSPVAIAAIPSRASPRMTAGGVQSRNRAKFTTTGSRPISVRNRRKSGCVSAVVAVSVTGDQLDDEIMKRFGGERWVD